MADVVLTISRDSKRQLLEVAPGAEKRIEVIGLGPGLRTGERPACERRGAGLFVMGSHLPHKATRETLHLLDRWSTVRERTRVAVSGMDGWPEAWGDPPRHLDVAWLGRLEDAALVRSLSASRALIFLSEIEGFGLPLLEAYMVGTPVCFRNTGAPAEIMGPGAPGAWDGASFEGFEAALNEVLNMSEDDAMRVRSVLLDRYNWRRTSMETMKIYKEMLNIEPA